MAYRLEDGDKVAIEEPCSKLIPCAGSGSDPVVIHSMMCREVKDHPGPCRVAMRIDGWYVEVTAERE